MNNIGNARRAYAKNRRISFTQEDAARYFGVSIGTYRNWEQGRVDLNSAQIAAVADLYETSVDYLLNYKQGQKSGEETLTYDDRELLGLFHKMDDAQQALLLAIAEEFARKA